MNRRQTGNKLGRWTFLDVKINRKRNIHGTMRHDIVMNDPPLNSM